MRERERERERELHQAINKTGKENEGEIFNRLMITSRKIVHLCGRERERETFNQLINNT